MFGRSKSASFKPYALRSSRPPRRVPAWLLWLLLGIVVGVSVVLFVQQNYLPPRLTAAESARLTQHVAQLQVALGNTQSQLEDAKADIDRREAERVTLSAQLGTARTALQPLQDDLSLVLEALPPDPRGGDTQIRAARFFNDNEALDYHVVLTREGSPLQGAVQFVVEGRYPNGRTATVELDPLPLRLETFENVRGQQPLPDGMRARQITVRVLDQGQRQQAMRVINSRN